MTKDWTGNQNSIFKTLGASNHTGKQREENDFYATEPKAIDLLVATGELGQPILDIPVNPDEPNEHLSLSLSLSLVT